MNYHMKLNIFLEKLEYRKKYKRDEYDLRFNLHRLFNFNGE